MNKIKLIIHKIPIYNNNILNSINENIRFKIINIDQKIHSMVSESWPDLSHFGIQLIKTLRNNTIYDWYKMME